MQGMCAYVCYLHICSLAEEQFGNGEGKSMQGEQPAGGYGPVMDKSTFTFHLFHFGQCQ